MKILFALGFIALLLILFIGGLLHGTGKAERELEKLIGDENDDERDSKSSIHNRKS